MEEMLSPVEARVLGALLEKEKTTPDYYPLTLHSLTAACSQKSNRDPVMALVEADVSEALDRLRDRKLVWQTAMAGSRVPKYKHAVGSVLGLTPLEEAVLCTLLLRGPQTLGEIRARSERLCQVPGTEDVAGALQAMSRREGGALVTELARETGQRESRFAHLLCGQAAASALPPPTDAPAATPAEDRWALLEQEVAGLRQEVEELQRRFAHFQRQFE